MCFCSCIKQDEMLTNQLIPQNITEFLSALPIQNNFTSLRMISSLCFDIN